MKSIISKFSLLLLIISNFAYSQNFEWIQHLGGTENSIGQAVDNDTFGNIYNIGRFSGSLEFENGTTLVSEAPYYTNYITKSDPLGNLIWVKQIINRSNSKVSLDIDENNNLYVSGKFNGEVGYDSNSDILEINSSSLLIFGTFFMKLNSEGDLIWAKKFDGTGMTLTSHKVNSNGDLILKGDFHGTVDFDPSEESYEFTSYGTGGFFPKYDLFIATYDNNGGFIWAKQIGGIGDEESSSMTLDGSNNIYISGNFLGETDFDPSTNDYILTSNGERDIYVSKYDEAGNFIWANQIGSTGQQLSNAMVIDSLGDLYITGYVEHSVDFDSSEDEFIVSGSDYDAFITKITSSGDFIWAKRFNGPGWSYGLDIALDNSNDVYMTGNFFGTTDFDPNDGEYNLTSTGTQGITGDYNIYTCKLNTNGDFVWANQFEGDGWNFGNAITVDDDYNVYTTGHFEGTIDIDPNETTNELTPINNYDAFMVKFSQNSLSITDYLNNQILVYPNPTKDILHIKSELNIDDIRLFNVHGQEIKLSLNNMILDMTGLDEGVYFLELRTIMGYDNRKIIKQ